MVECRESIVWVDFVRREQRGMYIGCLEGMKPIETLLFKGDLQILRRCVGMKVEEINSW